MRGGESQITKPKSLNTAKLEKSREISIKCLTVLLISFPSTFLAAFYFLNNFIEM